MATLALTASTFETTVTSNEIVLVDFWAAWCGPCQQFAPIFEDASERHPDVVFGKVDTETEQELATAANIVSIPTVMAFRDGLCVFSQPGSMSESGLRQLIEGVRALDMDDVRTKVAAARAARGTPAGTEAGGNRDEAPPEAPHELAEADAPALASRGREEARAGVDYPDEHGAIV